MRITKHAQSRIKERNVSPNELMDCATKGIRMVNKWDENKITIKSTTSNLYMVVSKDTTVLITVFRKEHD